MKRGKLPALKLREQCIDGFKVYTLYQNRFPYNCLLKEGGTIWGDCVCLVKSLIWAWSCGIHPFLNRKDHTYFYNGENGSYDGIGNSGLPDLDIDSLMSRTIRVSFSRLAVGTLLAYNGDHIGIHIGSFTLEGKTYNGVEFNYYNESVQGLIPFWIDSDGNKFWCKGGSYMGSFNKAGNLNSFIDYDNVKTVSYRSELSNGSWLPEVISTTSIDDTAGLPNKAMYGLMVASPTLKGYCVRCEGSNSFLPVVTGYDMNESENGYAGDMKPITDVAINDSGIAYRVKIKSSQEWLPAVYGRNYNLNDHENGYAGDRKVIDEIEIWRVD